MGNKKKKNVPFFGLNIGDASSTEAESSDIQFACQFVIWYKEESKVRIGLYRISSTFFLFAVLPRTRWKHWYHSHVYFEAG